MCRLPSPLLSLPLSSDSKGRFTRARVEHRRGLVQRRILHLHSPGCVRTGSIFISLQAAHGQER